MFPAAFAAADEVIRSIEDLDRVRIEKLHLFLVDAQLAVASEFQEILDFLKLGPEQLVLGPSYGSESARLDEPIGRTRIMAGNAESPNVASLIRAAPAGWANNSAAYLVMASFLRASFIFATLGPSPAPS
jgi:hypothetical protein